MVSDSSILHSSPILHLPPDGKLRALTVREPFASLIVMGLKPIENRTLAFPKTMPLPCTIAIHASTDDATIYDDVYDVTADTYIDQALNSPDYKVHTRDREYFYGGTIIGLIDVVGCVCISEYCDGSDESEEKIVELIDDPYPWPLGFQNPEAKRSDWANGPYCLVLNNPRRFRQGVVCRGQLNYWSIPAEKMQLVEEAMKSLLARPTELPKAPVGGVAKWLGRKAK